MKSLLIIAFVLFNFFAQAFDKGCSFISKNRCVDCRAIVKVKCGSIEGHVVNDTQIKSLELIITNTKTNKDRVVTLKNLGNITNLSGHDFLIERLAENAGVDLHFTDEVSIVKNSIILDDQTLLYSSMFGPRFNNVSKASVADAVDTGEGVTCEYTKGSLMMIEDLATGDRSCHGEVNCSDGVKVETSCAAVSLNKCMSALECRLSQDTIKVLTPAQ